MDASRRSTTLNAYFTGLGNSRRVVLYDSLVQACEPDETLSVVAHELGHWRGRHLLKLFALQAIGVASGLYALKLLLDVPAARSLFGLPTTDSLVVLVLLPLLSGMAGNAAVPHRCSYLQAVRTRGRPGRLRAGAKPQSLHHPGAEACPPRQGRPALPQAASPLVCLTPTARGPHRSRQAGHVVTSPRPAGRTCRTRYPDLLTPSPRQPVGNPRVVFWHATCLSPAPWHRPTRRFAGSSTSLKPASSPPSWRFPADLLLRRLLRLGAAHLPGPGPRQSPPRAAGRPDAGRGGTGPY